MRQHDEAVLNSTLRAAVLAGLARNRSPGLHFAGNFAPLLFRAAEPGGSHLALQVGAHIAEANGEASFGAVAMLADVALGVAIRSRLAPESRLATVALHLQLTGAPLAGTLEAQAAFEAFLEESSGRQGLARVEVRANEAVGAFGTGAFMVLPPPPGVALHPVVRERDDRALAESDLTPEERVVLARADAALSDANDAASPFISRFWGCEPEAAAGGARCVTPNGAHIANRVGHVQGGLLVWLAAATAACSLGPEWKLSSISSWFVSPGEGDELVTQSRVEHRGRLTAVVRSRVEGAGGRRVLESVSAHALR